VGSKHRFNCKDGKRKGPYEHERFDFLGFTFRPRLSKDKKGRYFVNFSPAISDKAGKAISGTIRSWRLHLRSDRTLEELAAMVNPRVQGWINYYGSYYMSAIHQHLRQLEAYLVRWAISIPTASPVLGKNRHWFSSTAKITYQPSTSRLIVQVSPQGHHSANDGETARNILRDSREMGMLLDRVQR
jgi:Group II intron, maturase-specific domain